MVVDRVGGEGRTLDFGADGFGGGFGRLGACFSTTSVLCEPLVFPNVFAALKSGFLEADAVFEGGCGREWLVSVLSLPAPESKIRLLVDLQGVLEPRHAWFDVVSEERVLWHALSSVRAYYCA